MRAAYLIAFASSAAAQCAPEQVRLALTAAQDGSSMTVSWATSNISTPAAYVGVVAFGASPSTLTSSSAPATSRNYTFDGYQSFFFHVTALTGLTARAAVFYQVQASAGCAASPIMNFSAAPVTGATSIYPFTVAAYADMVNDRRQPLAISASTRRRCCPRTPARLARLTHRVSHTARTRLRF